MNTSFPSVKHRPQNSSNSFKLNYLVKVMDSFIIKNTATWCQDNTKMMVIFWDILMFYQNSLSIQVKRNAIISNKHGINELPHELLDDLRLWILPQVKWNAIISNKHDISELPHGTWGNSDIWYKWVAPRVARRLKT